MNQTMTFPETIEEFIELYKFKDNEEVYTNGSELIQVYRIKQWIDAHPVKHGRWLPVKLLDDEADFGEVDGVECSVCGGTWHSEYWAKTYFKYCPYCGNPMDEVEE